MDSGRAYSVVIVEDHPLYRRAIVELLARDRRLEVLGSFAGGREALGGILDRKPDVAVIDLDLPDIDGSSLIAGLVAQRATTRSLVLSGYSDVDRAWAAFRAGASGYITKNLPNEAIREAVVGVCRGERVMSPDIQGAIADGIRDDASLDGSLTHRERAILRLCAQGLSRAAIGLELHISPSTVKAHLSNAFRKLGVATQAAAVAAAAKRDLL